jgi:hypothetical protein
MHFFPPSLPILTTCPARHNCRDFILLTLLSDISPVDSSV